MLRVATILMALIQIQVWGMQPACFSPECEPEPVKNCCSMPVEEEPLATGCGTDGHICPCCVISDFPVEQDPAKQLWETSIIHLVPFPADTFLPDEIAPRMGSTQVPDTGYILPNAPPRAVLSCWIL